MKISNIIIMMLILVKQKMNIYNKKIITNNEKSNRLCNGHFALWKNVYVKCALTAQTY